MDSMAALRPPQPLEPMQNIFIIILHAHLMVAANATYRPCSRP